MSSGTSPLSELPELSAHRCPFPLLPFLTLPHVLSASQLLQCDTSLYSRGDLGDEIYFILSGSVRKFLDDSAKVEVSRVMYIEKNKHAYLRGSYYKGCHFGEMCLISQHSRREANAIAETECQVYSLHKRSLWEIFQYMTRQDQRVFLIHLFTEVNGYCHTLFDEENIAMKLIARTLTSTIDNLYNLVDSVMNEIMDEGIRAGKIPESIKLVNDTFVKKQPVANSAGLLTCPWFEVLQVYEQKKVEVLSSAATSTGGVGVGGGSGSSARPSRLSRPVNFARYVSEQGGGEGTVTGQGTSEANDNLSAAAAADPNEMFYQKYCRKASKKVAFDTSSHAGSGKSNLEDDLSDASSHAGPHLQPADDQSGTSTLHSTTADAAAARPSIDDMLRVRIMDLFQFMDTDDAGELSREQILESLKALGWESVTGDVLDRMIQDADRSGQDRVDFEGIVDVILAAMGQVSPTRHSPVIMAPAPLEVK
jgi:CRP-like cAMP-binding protein